MSTSAQQIIAWLEHAAVNRVIERLSEGRFTKLPAKKLGLGQWAQEFRINNGGGLRASAVRMHGLFAPPTWCVCVGDSFFNLSFRDPQALALNRWFDKYQKAEEEAQLRSREYQLRQWLDWNHSP